MRDIFFRAVAQTIAVPIALICAISAARAQQSSTAEAERYIEGERYIKESESQWANSVANGDASVVERILARLLRSRPYFTLGLWNMSLGTERDHQPSADALARRPAIHRALPGDGRSLSLGQIGGRFGGAGERQASFTLSARTHLVP